MKMLGNLLWFIFGGLEMGIAWLAAGILWSLTIVGIPLGKQCFKFAGLSFFPFKKDIEYGGGTVSLIANVLWLLFTGIPMAIANLVIGALLCVTIVGIPFGKQYFKLAKLSLMPFGAEIRKR